MLIWNPTAWLTHGFPHSILCPFDQQIPKKRQEKTLVPLFHHSQPYIFLGRALEKDITLEFSMK